MREIKFRYYQAPGDGDTEWNKQEHTLQDIESGKLDSIMLAQKKYYRIHGPFQFTGLKDKNGKEIYEGDIVKHSDESVGEVVYWTAVARYIVQFNDDLDSWDSFDMYDMGYSVIGNVYENPELLEK